MTLEEFLISIEYWLKRKKMPFFWGNLVWYSFEDHLIPAKNIKPKSKYWTDYGKITQGSTSQMLEVEYEYSLYRKKLNNQILDLYLSERDFQRLENPIAIITCGGTASGKTSAVDELVKNLFEPQKIDFLRIDYDGIKTHLSEYLEMLQLKSKYAAGYVQSESSKIGGRIFKKALARKFNLIYEKTLDDEVRALQDIKKLKKKGYSVFIVATHIIVSEGLKRAQERYEKKGRYVPEDVIKEIYSNVPKSLFAIRKKVDGIFLYDNSSKSLKLVFQKVYGGQSNINRLPYNQYLIDVGNQYDLSQ